MSTVQEPPVYRLGDFTLDVPNRQLYLQGERLDLNARYFDALVLLVREHGRLVEKDRFFEEVWSDVVVSDSALTQCIKEIRRLLGDDASNPRFIQTVPRHGYRFIAEVSSAEGSSAEGSSAEGSSAEGSSAEGSSAEGSSAEGSVSDRTGTNRPPADLSGLAGTSEVAAPSTVPATDVASPSTSAAGHTAPRIETAYSKAMATTVAGTLGGAVAGLMGGLLYGFGFAYSPVAQELGTASVLVVMLSLSGFAGTVGGFGIGAGMAAAEYAAGGRTAWRIAGAVLGGMLVGGSVKLLGVDAFNLLFGRAPAGVTGGMEGAALGFAVGLGAHLAGGLESTAWWRPVAVAAAAGALVGVSIALAGGHLMGGSLDLLAQSFSESRLQLDAFGRYFGEVRFGRTSQVVLAGIEGLLFAGCVVGALAASRRAPGGHP